MYMLTKPSDDQINKFIEAQSRLDFTYSYVGSTKDGQHPSSFKVDHNRIQLGAGEATFNAARRALCHWQHYRFDWIELHRPDRDPQPDQTVGVLARALALWVLNVCRVVYVVEDERRFAFAYGTLPEHAEAGEERFQDVWSVSARSGCDFLLLVGSPQTTRAGSFLDAVGGDQVGVTEGEGVSRLMPTFICTTCGTQFAETDQPPAECKICTDERQLVGLSGQQWTTLDGLRQSHQNVVRLEEFWAVLVPQLEVDIGQAYG